MRFIILLLLLALISGCLASASKMNAVRVGMEKDEVIQKLGKPASVTVDDSGEHLNYSLAETATSYGNPGTPYEVLLVGGKVKSFGRAGQTAPARQGPMILPVTIGH